jgi:hypothetical protein
MKLVVLIFFFYSCKDEDQIVTDETAGTNRTVLVYLGVDNNFRSEASEKIEQLKSNRDRYTDGNLFVYADTGESPVLVHIYRHQTEGCVADTIETYPPENSADPATLTRVLNRAKAYRPADSYGLVVLSHATGWLPAGMSKPSPSLRSVIWDTGTPERRNYMELADFADAIPYKLDFIIFDACFMGAVEVCYELKDKADYIVASPAEVIAPGFVYSTMMQHLFKPEPDLTSVANEFYEYYNRQNNLARSATVSVVKTSELEALATIFREIVGQSHDTDVEDIEAIQSFGYGSQKIYFDLGDYIQKLSPSRYGEFKTVLSQCIMYKKNTPSYYSAGTSTAQAIHAFSGLSLYVPQEPYAEANEAYKKLKWAADIRNISATSGDGI